MLCDHCHEVYSQAVFPLKDTDTHGRGAGPFSRARRWPLSFIGAYRAQIALQAASDLSAEVHILVGQLIKADRLTGTTDVEDMAGLQAIFVADAASAPRQEKYCRFVEGTTIYPSATQFTERKWRKAMTRTGARPLLLDLVDELLVASTLLAMMHASDANRPMLMGMCANSIDRCKALTQKLILIDSRGN